MMMEVTSSHNHPGFYYYAVFTGLDLVEEDMSFVDYGRRPIREDYLALALGHLVKRLPEGHGFVVTTEWVESDAPPEEPWYIEPYKDFLAKEVRRHRAAMS